MIMAWRFVLLVLFLASGFASAPAETLTSSNVQIVWKVSNRFRLFRDPNIFKQQELAWRQYGQHVTQHLGSTDDSTVFYYNSSVLGTEHVLNDHGHPVLVCPSVQCEACMEELIHVPGFLILKADAELFFYL